MAAFVKVGGAWRTLTPQVKVAGTWRGLAGGWVKVAGVWRKFYPSIVDTQTVTIGSSGAAGSRSIGFAQTASLGACSDGTFNPLSNAPILLLYWAEAGQVLYFRVQGNFSNSGWETLTFAGGLTFNRSAAGFAQIGGTETQWNWGTVNSNPFGATSGTKVITFG